MASFVMLFYSTAEVRQSKRLISRISIENVQMKKAIKSICVKDAVEIFL